MAASVLHLLTPALLLTRYTWPSLPAPPLLTLLSDWWTDAFLLLVPLRVVVFWLGRWASFMVCNHCMMLLFHGDILFVMVLSTYYLLRHAAFVPAAHLRASLSPPALCHAHTPHLPTIPHCFHTTCLTQQNVLLGKDRPHACLFCLQYHPLVPLPLLLLPLHFAATAYTCLPCLAILIYLYAYCYSPPVLCVQHRCSSLPLPLPTAYRLDRLNASCTPPLIWYGTFPLHMPAMPVRPHKDKTAKLYIYGCCASHTLPSCVLVDVNISLFSFIPVLV